MSILDKYGVKEVFDMTFYEIEADGSRGKPVIFLDTLKISTVEQTAEVVEARGGQGAPRLIVWDYGKDIVLNLTDALFSMKSLSMSWGDGSVITASGDNKFKVVRTIKHLVPATGEKELKKWKDKDGSEHTLADVVYTTEAGVTTPAEDLVAGNLYYATFSVTADTAYVVEVTPNQYPGTYYIIGDTVVRSEITGKDEAFQLIIPKGKVLAGQTLTFEAEGDPSVFDMEVMVLKAADGKMMKLVKYELPVVTPAP